eukprot:CAMPEP_0178998564 /NCGR_PEP_ID=MMETSP0795-20121207/9578_1 /TAXON_ID=88552 /ORGANISM="Amoebophrya sp., Strain Ameob2" /LENGTH=394 /DNA_ID=CAMNT_0020691247 /DNA_START=44 /DNA_END=1229 /DNA_ORIENTATION=-
MPANNFCTLGLMWLATLFAFASWFSRHKQQFPAKIVVVARVPQQNTCPRCPAYPDHGKTAVENEPLAVEHSEEGLQRRGRVVPEFSQQPGYAGVGEEPPRDFNVYHADANRDGFHQYVKLHTVEIFLHSVKICVPPQKVMHVLDVGANVGGVSKCYLDLWAMQDLRDVGHYVNSGGSFGVAAGQVAQASLLNSEKRFGVNERMRLREFHVHQFEPLPANVRILNATRAAMYQRPGVFLHLNHAGVGKQSGELWIAGNVAAGNTLQSLSNTGGAGKVRVPVFSLDDYLLKQKIESVTFAKIDAEGLEYSIAEGMAESAQAGKLPIFAFEYTKGKVPLKKLVALLTSWDYRLFVLGRAVKLELSTEEAIKVAANISPWDGVAIKSDHPNLGCLLMH